jgi:TIR domain-containing protein
MSQFSQEGRPKTKVFVSYARKDREIVERISRALQKDANILVFKDTEDILPTEEWRNRLESLISSVDTVVFCLSPESVKSDVCAWEVKTAEKFKKRIAPIVIRDTTNVPNGLSKFHYIVFTEHVDFDSAVSKLTQALNTDIAWVREHTRIGQLAERWKASGKSNDQLLRGRDLNETEQWVRFKPSNGPELTATTIDFVGASRTEAAAAARRARRAKVTLLALTGTATCIAALAYAGVLDASYIEGRINYVRNSLREASLKPGDVVVECARLCPEMVVVPSGSYMMGKKTRNLTVPNMRRLDILSR